MHLEVLHYFRLDVVKKETRHETYNPKMITALIEDFKALKNLKLMIQNDRNNPGSGKYRIAPLN